MARIVESAGRYIHAKSNSIVQFDEGSEKLGIFRYEKLSLLIIPSHTHPLTIRVGKKTVIGKHFMQNPGKILELSGNKLRLWQG